MSLETESAALETLAPEAAPSLAASAPDGESGTGLDGISAGISDAELLEKSIAATFAALTTISGQIILPCLPSLIGSGVQLVEGLFDLLGSPFDQEELHRIRSGMIHLTAEAFQKSPNAKLVVAYETSSGSRRGLTCRVTTQTESLSDRYQEWIDHREPPLFGSHPDAKVMALATELQSLGDPATIPILDVGAGPGRNALPLAKLGYAVDVLEPVSGFVEQLEAAAAAEAVPLSVIQGDILDPLIRLRPAYYRLAIAAEVVASHFRDLDQVRLFLAKLCDGVKSGGYILFSAFLAVEGFIPDDRVRELSQAYWCYIITRPELQAAMVDLPLDWVSDESVHDYEQAHLPPEAWPPTSWFVNWATGSSLFPARRIDPSNPEGEGSNAAPRPAWMDLRWILCRRR